MTHEWPLILFTLLVQAGIGLTILSLLAPVAAENQQKITLSAVSLTAVALFASLLHLGDPMGAYRAIFNLKSSWLSREIFATSLFFGLLVIQYGCFRYANLSASQQRNLHRAAAAAGLISAFVMAAAYTHSSIPAWTTGYTYITFVSAVLALGGVLLGAFSLNGHNQAATLAWAGLANLIALLLQAGGLFVYLSSLTGGNAAAQMTLNAYTSSWALLALSFVLPGLGAAALGMAWHKSTLEMPAQSFYTLAAVTVAAGSILTRYLFFACATPWWKAF